MPSNRKVTSNGTRTATATATNTNTNINTNNNNNTATRTGKNNKSKYHHCYLLKSQLSQNRTYIGYTVNPKRRIKQHNGIIKGGAYKTSRARPWDIICVVSGFSTQVEGLRFEWAWQNPLKSNLFRSGFDCNGDGGGSKGQDNNNGDDNGDDYNNSNANVNTNSGSNRALVDLVLKSCGKYGLKRQLTILMILLCECNYYKEQKLQVNFLEKENELMFLDLFRGSNNDNNHNHNHHNNDANTDEDDDDEFANWCNRLPPQMGCVTISSLDVMPFASNQNKKKKKRKRKQNNSVVYNDDDDDDDDTNIINNEEVGLAQVETPGKDTGLLDRQEKEKEGNQQNIPLEDYEDHNIDNEEILQEIQNLSIMGEEEEQQQLYQQHHQPQQPHLNQLQESTTNHQNEYHSNCVIELLDSESDSEDKLYNLQVQSQNQSLESDISSCSSSDDGTIDCLNSCGSNSSDETIDLTSNNELLPKKASDIIIDLVSLTSLSPCRKKRSFCHDSSSDSSATIDLCSPRP